MKTQHWGQYSPNKRSGAIWVVSYMVFFFFFLFCPFVFHEGKITKGVERNREQNLQFLAQWRRRRRRGEENEYIESTRCCSFSNWRLWNSHEILQRSLYISLFYFPFHMSYICMHVCVLLTSIFFTKLCITKSNYLLNKLMKQFGGWRWG